MKPAVFQPGYGGTDIIKYNPEADIFKIGISFHITLLNNFIKIVPLVIKRYSIDKRKKTPVFFQGYYVHIFCFFIFEKFIYKGKNIVTKSKTYIEYINLIIFA